ncbi:MAG: GerMN domain-containing protein [Elusimicrobiota bacterium]
MSNVKKLFAVGVGMVVAVTGIVAGVSLLAAAGAGNNAVAGKVVKAPLVVKQSSSAVAVSTAPVSDAVPPIPAGNNKYKISFMKDSYPGDLEREAPAAEDLPADPVERTKYIIKEWLQGPTDEEKALGYTTLISTGAWIKSCVFNKNEDGYYVVEIDFSTEILKNLDEEKIWFIHDQMAYMLTSMGMDNIVGTKMTVGGRALASYLEGNKRKE